MQNNQQQIVSAIIVAGVLIAGAVLLKGSSAGTPTPAAPSGNAIPTAVTASLAPVGAQDKILGNPQAKLTIIMYEDFQCPFCGKFFQESEQPIRDTYIKNGDARLVYRDFAFLGPESVHSAEGALCAADQGKFWEYHDYLFSHQNGENKGAFVDKNLESFAKTLGLNTSDFNNCLESGKYAQKVADSKTEGAAAGVTGTPKGFILKAGKVAATIDGAEPFPGIKAKIDAALK